MADRSSAVAAIDCGTNSTRLLIVDATGATVERLMRITRLGEGVDANHALSVEAIARTAAVLAEYRRAMDGHAVHQGRLVATSAVRDARNAEDFFSAARDATGLRPELLSGEEEGRLSFAGATAHLPVDLVGPGPVLVVDIGGGSTELSMGTPGGAGPTEGVGPTQGTRLVSSVSLDIGCVRITERFLHHDPPRADEMAAARQTIDDALGQARRELPELAAGGAMVGLAGTVSTLAALARELRSHDRALIHHAVLTRSEVRRWLDWLGAESAAARLTRPGMVEGRADVIVGGVLVLDAVMEHFECSSCVVSEDDILDGLAASLR